MRIGALLLLCIIALAGPANASEAQPPHRENNPHMGALEQPVLWARDKIRIEAPPGYPVCAVLESFSSVASFFVPLDPATPCEQFDKSGEELPDHLIIDPYLDTAMNTATLEDYIRQWQTFFCAGRHPSFTADPLAPSSDAPTTRAPAGRRLMGLETVTCTRIDKKNDRYTKAYIAYKPDPINLDGRGYTVGAYVHLKNRKAANRLLEQVVALLKPLK